MSIFRITIDNKQELLPLSTENPYLSELENHLSNEKNKLNSYINKEILDLLGDDNVNNIELDMTVCCDLGTCTDTKCIYDKFHIDDSSYKDFSSSNKKYLSNARGIIGCKAESFPVKGSFENDKKCTFFNSAALNVLVSDNKCINLKLFKNGKVQMTHVPNIDIGYYCVQLVIDYLKNNDDNTTKKSISDIKKIGIFFYKIVFFK